MKRLFSLIAVLFISIALIGCANIFKSYETLDNTDKAEKAKIAQEEGSTGQVKEYNTQLLQENGYEADIVTKAATEELRSAYVDLAGANLKDAGVSLLDTVGKVAEAMATENNSQFFPSISQNLPPLSNLEQVSLNAAIMRENVDTSNGNAALNAATAELVATTMLATVTFDNDGDGQLTASDNENVSDNVLITEWNNVSQNLLEHSSSAVDLFGYTSAADNNSSFSDASKKLDDLKALNQDRTNGLADDATFAQRLRGILNN